jgi:hypothetical protein
VRLEVRFDERDFDQLTHALREARAGNVERLAQQIGEAGAREALDFATGHVTPTTIAELRSYRMCCLLDRLLRDGMDLAEIEPVVGAIFKIPAASAAREVVKAFARFPIELGDWLRQAVVAALESASWDKEKDYWVVKMPAKVVHEWVLEVSHLRDLPRPKAADLGSEWGLPNKTYNHLRQLNGLERREIPPAR